MPGDILVCHGLLFLQASCSARRHFSLPLLCGNSFCHPEARDAAKYPAIHRTVPLENNYPTKMSVMLGLRQCIPLNLAIFNSTAVSVAYVFTNSLRLCHHQYLNHFKWCSTKFKDWHSYTKENMIL